MKTIFLPAGATHVLFGEIAHRIADALWPDAGEHDMRVAYGAALLNLDGELAQAVQDGLMAVKDPLTFGPHTFPIGDALNRALVPVEDLREFVLGRGVNLQYADTAPVQSASDGKAKRRTWRDVAWPYMVDVLNSGRYATAKQFYNDLEKKAGAKSPFDRGTDVNRGSLFVREVSETVSLKTVQNAWAELKKSGQRA